MRRKTDHQLVHDYIAGDIHAFNLIVRRHERNMLGVALRYSRNECDAEDIVQDALLKASRHLYGFRFESKVSTWLYRLVANASLDHQRRRKAEYTVSLDDNNELSQDKDPRLAHDPTANLDRLIAVKDALRVVPEAHRKAVFLIDIMGMSLQSAADTCGVQPGTMKSRRARARAMMLEHMEGAC